MRLRSFLLLLASVSLIGCGSSNSTPSSSNSTSDVSIRFSDAPVENLSSVTITVDQIIFNREGEDIIVDTFTSDELGIEDAETFEIDLLEVQGNDNRLVLDSVSLPVGEYQNLRIVVLDEDINLSYVDEIDSSMRKEIKVPSDQLKLGAFEVGDRSSQTFVIEFGLRQAMTYNPGPDRYILKPRGVRIVRLENASTISGTVDLAELHTMDGCSDKADSTIDNVAYLYAGHELDVALLSDVFVREFEGAEPGDFDPDVDEDRIAPAVATSIDGDTGDYLFSYLKPGDYTLAISCKAGGDDPVIYDEIAIPLPENTLLEVSLEAEEDLDCDFPEDDICSEIE